jgi:hypothetical protein
MAKHTEVPENYDEMNADSFLDQFEKNGAAISSPVLPEGNYKANILAFTIRYGFSTPTKGPNQGKETPYAFWGVKLALDSAEANKIMKRDNEVNVYADNDTENLRRGSINLGAFGISNDNNAAFWVLVGSILAQVGLAEKTQDDSGHADYKISRDALNAIYADLKVKKPELEADSEIDPRQIPAKLAELQLQRLTEYLTGEPETRFVYVHLQHQADFSDKSRQKHFVKKMILKADFEQKESNLDSLIL